MFHYRRRCWLLLPSFLTAIPAGAFLPGINVRRSHTSSQHHMFTAIVEEMGTVVSLKERDDMVLWDGTKGKGTELLVKGDVVMEGGYLG